MHGVVKIRGLGTLYSLTELPEDRSELDLVEEGAAVAVPPELGGWPIGAVSQPSPRLGRCKADPKKFRLFELADELEPAGYEPTGLTYGGVYTPEMWRRLVKMIPMRRAFAAIPADPPGVMEKALEYIREGR